MSRGRIHRVLMEVEAGRGTARERLDALPAQPGEDPRDLVLAREVVYGTLRRLGTIDHLLGVRSRERLPSLDPPVRAALRAAAYQVLFLDRIPAPAAVNEAVEAARRAAGKRAGGYANAVLRALSDAVEGRFDGEEGEDPRRSVPTGDGRHVRLRSRDLPDPARDPGLSLALRWSMPRWLVRRWGEHPGEEGRLRILRASAARPGTWLRALPGGGTALRDGLTAAGVAFEENPAEAGAFLLRGAGAVEDLPGFAEGRFLVQDPAAARAVALLAPVPGESVLEIGAGRGGKTAFLAARTAPGGRVTAVDLHEGRLEQLRATLERLALPGADVVVVRADALDGDALPAGPFDALLVDAPCSNTGVLARRVEARHRLRPRDIEVLGARGRRLLEAGLSRLRPGGRAVHSVCSLEPEEGPLAVRRALKRVPGFEIVTEETLLPEAGVRDGGYAAVIGPRAVSETSQPAGSADGTSG